MPLTMTKFYTFIILFFVGTIVANAQPTQNVGVGTTTPDASSILHVASNTKGLLIPTMNTIQRMNIVNPANGLLVYDTDYDQFWYYNEAISDWKQASGAQSGDWGGICIYNSSDHNNVGAPCTHMMKSPVMGIQQCLPGWTWINVSASNQISGSANTAQWTGACIKN